jgi:MoaA/NifB/PqqE/SkfB family radical SAM enzyme
MSGSGGKRGRRWRNRARIYRFHLGEFVRCTTPRKLANLIVVKAQRRLRRERLAGLPYHYFIDPMNVCNLRCPLCPTGRGVLARPRGRMAMEDLKRIVDEIAPYAYRIELYNWGEPLLHPDILEMIRYARGKRIMVGLSSNLNRLDRATARQLVASGLSQLVVSIDGADQETYAAYRRGGQLDQVLENLALLIGERQALGSRTPFLIWRMLVGRHNEAQVEDVERLAYDMGVDSFTTGLLYVDTRDLEQVAQWLPADPAYSPYDGEEPIENRWDCRDLWESMVINWDGGVSPCCWLHDPAHDFGNAARDGVRAVWNNPSYLSARRVIGRRGSADTLSGAPDGVETICHRCQGRPDYMAY